MYHYSCMVSYCGAYIVNAFHTRVQGVNLKPQSSAAVGGPLKGRCLLASVVTHSWQVPPTHESHSLVVLVSKLGLPPGQAHAGCDLRGDSLSIARVWKLGKGRKKANKGCGNEWVLETASEHFSKEHGIPWDSVLNKPWFWPPKAKDAGEPTDHRGPGLQMNPPTPAPLWLSITSEILTFDFWSPARERQKDAGSSWPE